MSKPIIADNAPVKVTLEQGKKYAFCACGRSGNQPFCDGSHSGTGITPKMFTAEENTQAFLCQCKHTSDAPFCDGTHANFDKSEVGTEGAG
jgi:CDGSH-type Zn-finger protein